MKERGNGYFFSLPTSALGEEKRCDISAVGDDASGPGLSGPGAYDRSFGIRTGSVLVRRKMCCSLRFRVLAKLLFDVPVPSFHKRR